MSYLPDHYRAINRESGHAYNCAWGGGADCNCGKHTCPDCGFCGDCFCHEIAEEANQAGMAHGVEAANEVRGSGPSGPPDCPTCLRPKEPGHHGCVCVDDDACEGCEKLTGTEKDYHGEWLCSECREMVFEGYCDSQADSNYRDYDDSPRPRGGADLWWDKESGEPRCG